MMKKILPSLLLVFLTGILHAQPSLTVEKIMRDPRWIGVAPSFPFWSEDGTKLYFNWNPDQQQGDSLYSITLTNRTPVKVSPAERRSIPSPNGVYNRLHTKKVYERNGDIYLYDKATNRTQRITSTNERESQPVFSFDEKSVLFQSQGNLFSWELAGGAFSQLTDFRKGKRNDPRPGDQERWLKADQLAYIRVLKERSDKRKATEKMMKAERPVRPREIYIDDKSADQIQLSPDGKFITYRLSKQGGGKTTIVPNYVTESGFTEDIPSRVKVGAQQNALELWVYDIANDTTYAVKTDNVPGIQDVPSFRKDSKAKGNRPVVFFGPYWSENGQNNVVVMRAVDNKDRWLMSLDPANRTLKLIDRQHDDAWIGGPGTGFGPGNIGWIGAKLWFQSEATGYSHLYVHDFASGKTQALTNGSWEVQQVDVSRDKKFFYITTNEVHPGEKHFYKLPVEGGKATRLTTLPGAHEVTLSPDEKWMAIRYSYTNKPWELYLQENKAGASPSVVTQSLTAEFKSYPWRDAPVVTFKARDGADVYTRIFKPEKPNGAAVIFVHGAGYTQNAHRWWSSYFREYMFHNLLADKGYTVLDIDYRASAGYGRDWRTGIYRFMGGKDLEDHIDAAKWLKDQHQIDPKRIGIYGGSYGGFITLMGMFTSPGTFASGAALRPVTDWAHYNHPYTSNILNEPVYDSLSYAKSSPIYHAEGLQGHLLICHGMVDVNVHFQDAVRLTQRLIELGKDNWEMAVYPVEDHGFVEPSSWTDEYKRILKLFEQTLK